jgi:integrase
MREPRSTPWTLYEREDSHIHQAERTARGKRLRQTTGHTDKKLALLVIERWNREDADPVYKASTQTTVGAAVLRFLEEVARRVRPATLSAYRGQCGHLVRVFGKDSPLVTITATAVDDYVKQRTDRFVCGVHTAGNKKEPCDRVRPCGEGSHPHTTKKELCCLRGVLRLARRRGEYSADPDQVLPEKWNAKYEPGVRKHTLQQAWKLLQAVEDPERRAHLAYFYGTGGRDSEVGRARPRDHVNWTAGTVFIDGTKTKESTRTIPITPISKPILELAVSGLPEGQETYRRWGNRLRDLKAACKRAKVPLISFNDMRRSFCTWHWEAGVPNHLLAKYMGHTTTELVDRVYGKPSVEGVKALTDAHFASRPVEPAVARVQAPAIDNVVPITAAKRRRTSP